MLRLRCSLRLRARRHHHIHRRRRWRMQLFAIIYCSSHGAKDRARVVKPYVVVTDHLLSCSATSMPTSSLATTTNAMNPDSGLVPSSGCRVLGGQNIRNYRRRHGRRQRCHADQPKEKRCAPCTGGKPTGALQHASKMVSAIWNHRHCKELPVDDRQRVGDRGCLVWGSRS